MAYLTFKEYLAEVVIDDDATVQQAQKALRLAQTNPAMAKRKEFIRQKAEADVAKQDDTMDPEEQRLEKDEANLARRRASLASKQQQQKGQQAQQ